MVGERWSVEFCFILIQCHPRWHEQLEGDLLSFGSHGIPKFSKSVSAVYLFFTFFSLLLLLPRFSLFLVSFSTFLWIWFISLFSQLRRWHLRIRRRYWTLKTLWTEVLSQFFPGCYNLYLSQGLNSHDCDLHAVMLIGARNGKLCCLDCAVFVQHRKMRVVLITEFVYGITYWT